MTLIYIGIGLAVGFVIGRYPEYATKAYEYLKAKIK